MPELNDGDCYGFERKSAGDFPFYRQPPNALSGRSWVLILLGVVLGFAVLTAHIGFYKTTAGGFVPAILFPLIPLAVLAELEKRKATILKTIAEQEKLTPELERRIRNCWNATELEDIYLPFKPRRRTRAQVAREQEIGRAHV